MSNSIILFLIIGTLVGILAYIFYYNRKASKAKGEQKKKIKSRGCLITSLIIIGIFGYLFIYTPYSLFFTTKFSENTNELINDAPEKYLSYTGLIFPEDGKIIHVSTKKFGPNYSSDIIFSVTNVEKFIQNIKKKYELKSSKMKYPEIEGDKDYNILISDLCGNLNHDKDLVVKNIENLKNFCNEKKIMISHIKNEVEHGTIIVILPSEKLIWVNDTGWF